jgi:hypothetical protein
MANRSIDQKDKVSLEKKGAIRMGLRPYRARILIAACVLVAASAESQATEYAFSTYGLGSAAFGAGVTPPPGTYVTGATAFYDATIGGALNFGGVIINAGAEVDGFAGSTNILYVPARKVLGGNLGLAVTVPIGHLDVDATVGLLSRETDGWGFGDITSRAQLGWQHGDFAHLIYVQVVAPTGRWQPGFSPIIGLHRPGIDTGWAVTWTDRTKKLQLNGAVGFTFNFENTATNYQSGNEFHFEWAAGLEFAPGLMVGVVGYDYRQLTPDSGSGATLGPFKGRVDAIGPGLTYTTLIGTTPLIINARRYQEYNAHNRWEGSSTIISGTIRF